MFHSSPAIAALSAVEASGTYNTMRWFGAVFGVAILVAVFAATGGYALPHSFTQGFSRAIAASAAIALVGAAIGLALPSKQATTTIPAIDNDKAPDRRQPTTPGT